MKQYRVCPDCGTNLDPGEKCDCREEKRTPVDLLASAKRAAEIEMNMGKSTNNKLYN